MLKTIGVLITLFFILLILPPVMSASVYGGCAYGEDAYQSCSPPSASPTSQVKTTKTNTAGDTDEPDVMVSEIPSPDVTANVSPTPFQTEIEESPTDVRTNGWLWYFGGIVAISVAMGLAVAFIKRK